MDQRSRLNKIYRSALEGRMSHEQVVVKLEREYTKWALTPSSECLDQRVGKGNDVRQYQRHDEYVDRVVNAAEHQADGDEDTQKERQRGRTQVEDNEGVRKVTGIEKVVDEWSPLADKCLYNPVLQDLTLRGRLEGH